MPEYMTKSEPVDKKPYIVYTDEKGILYSGDPDSDIPGGGSNIGSLGFAPFFYHGTIAVGDSMSGEMTGITFLTLSVDENAIFDNTDGLEFNNPTKIAANTECQIVYEYPTFLGAFIVSVDMETQKFKTVEAADINAELTDSVLKFIMPEMEEDKFIIFRSYT